MKETIFSFDLPIVYFDSCCKIRTVQYRIEGTAKDSENFEFGVYLLHDGSYICMNDHIECLTGTPADCEKRFTDPIRQHIEGLINTETASLMIH